MEVSGVFGIRGLVSAMAGVGGKVVAVFRRGEGSQSLTGWGGVVWPRGHSHAILRHPQREFQR
jgi:hypothetical protein